ncbi:hypothetical protein AJ80_06328 [Polytolypa hystricis UAMH7299]|uniref:DASH complex subunit SPC19 n=1 Tax=Polytolypa hystricis (strain UAMH7299) TaxID=1447883 RepID=A0A2B7XX02_POLH7|nr:hypothetical protein AJ80_06328 [Polytolypa hystricis UAMH7299]
MAESLSSSVTSLQSSLQCLESSIDILDAGVSDFPRLTKILQTTRHFELLPEPTVREAQAAILDEITPSIAHLLSVASNHVEKLARREEALRAKAELQEGRLSHDSRPSSRSSSRPQQQRRPGVFGGGGGLNDGSGRAAELKKLVQKKERLQYAVERLELQAKQRQRELRKSMAAQ